MKKIIIFAILILSAISASARFSVGMTDSRYVYGIYTPVKHLDISLQHSLYSEKFGFQRIGVGVDYGMPFGKGFRWEAGAFGATTWNRNYQVVGAHASLGYAFKRLGLLAKIQPYYDSGLGYNTAWMAQASCRIIDSMSILAGYSTIPEYRVSEKRIRGGFEFRVAQLKVRPELSVSLDGNTRMKNLRVLMSMQYDF